MILLFVGAGGAAAVDPKQYPVTRVFFDNLSQEIRDNPLFINMEKKFFEGTLNKKIDIEDILGALSDFQKHHKAITNPRTFLGWINRGAGGLIPATGLNPINGLHDGYASSLDDMIKRQVYDFYGKPPHVNKLSTWIKLLKELKKLDPHIEIFTTNYDQILEYAADHAKINIHDGLIKKTGNLCINTSLWKYEKRPLPDNKDSLLTKLHGSVNWQYFDGEITITTPRFTETHEHHCILYPGHKGDPQQEPFVMFHDHLEKVIRQEYEPLTAALFIGFAFRDEYINRILRDFPSDTPTCFMTESGGSAQVKDKPPLYAPYAKNCIHFRRGLTDETVSTCLNYLNERKSQNRWLLLTEENINKEKDNGGVFELGISQSKGMGIILVDDSSKVKSRLEGCRNTNNFLLQDATHYRVEYTPDHEQRRRELLDQHISVSGLPPRGNV